MNAAGVTRNLRQAMIRAWLYDVAMGVLRMKYHQILVLGAILSTQAGCTCGSAQTAVPMYDAGMDAPPPKVVCNDKELETGCVVAQCKVTATGNPLPRGASLTITANPIPSTLTGDTIAPVLCSIAVSEGVKTVPNLTLSISGSSTPASTAALFQYVSPILSQLVGTSGADGKDVVGIVTAPGEFGATEKPGDWSISGTVGTEVSASSTQAELLLNLSSQSSNGSFYDGTHLLIANGSRVLIYDGIPANPGVHPSIVLGQPDLDTIEPQTTSSLLGNSDPTGIWSDGTRIVVADNYRILIWNTFPTTSLVPADIVLGQPDFGSNTPNVGGESAATLNLVWSVDSDGTQLAASDLRNNRVLVWKTFPTIVDQAADFEVGEPDFVSEGVNAGAVPIYQAWGAAFDTSGLFLTGLFSPGLVHVPPVTANNPSSDFSVLGLSTTLPLSTSLYTAGPVTKWTGGGLAVRDVYLARIAMLTSMPTGPVSSIDFVLGQPDTTRVVESLVSASVVSSSIPTSPSPGLGSGAVLTVPDLDRVLVFDTPPRYNFAPASRVVGQAGLSTNGPTDYRGISASTLAGPADVAVANGTIAVADRGNNRVLLYSATAVTANGTPATVVLGQANATSYIPNVDQQTPSATTLSGPAGVSLDGTHLIVSDTENHRVLIWNTVPTTTGTPADLVLGQTSFSARLPNAGRGDSNGDGFSDPDATGFFYPMGVASDGTHVFVADRLNNRVLIWNSFPTLNGQPADAVIGQPNFVTPQANAGNGAFTIAADGLDLPTGVTLSGTRLWIADTENNRLVRWDNVTTSPTPGVVIGQTSLTSVANSNYQLGYPSPGFPTNPAPATTIGSVLRPRSVVVSGGVLFCTEMDSNRVHMFDATSFAPVGELGQASDTVGTPDTNGVTAATLALPLGAASDGSNLWIADSGNHRVLAFGVATALTTGAPANLAIGQVSLLTGGFNQSSTAADGATSRPHGLTFANDELYIADTGNSRVLVMKAPVVAGDEPVIVYGQPNGTLALQNSGGPPSASTLNEPRGVFVDGARVLIADTANNRVLVYGSSTSTTATLVLGQASFTTNAPNASGPSASTMQAPTGAYTDGTSLWIADSGNHRVLVWKIFPTKNGQPADWVLGQSSFSGILGNRGGSEATPASLSFPSDVKVVNGSLFIADSGNNRVVSYSMPPTASGAAADGVLGQPNLTSRLAAVLPTDLTHMAGPVALAQDQENLYVADRDLGRALVFHIGTLTNANAAVQSLGAAGGLVVSGPGGIAAEKTGLFTSLVYMSDAGQNQIDLLTSVGRLVIP